MEPLRADQTLLRQLCVDHGHRKRQLCNRFPLLFDRHSNCIFSRLADLRLEPYSSQSILQRTEPASVIERFQHIGIQPGRAVDIQPVFAGSVHIETRIIRVDLPDFIRSGIDAASFHIKQPAPPVLIRCHPQKQLEVQPFTFEDRDLRQSRIILCPSVHKTFFQ